MIEKRELRVREIEDNLTKIFDAIQLIEENLPDDLQTFLSLGLLKDGIYKKTEFVIESVLDICNIINSDLRLGMPEVEDNIIDNLEKNKIFSVKIISLIREMKKFRNVLIHKYGKVDDSKAYEEIMDGLKDFELIISEIELFVSKHSDESKLKSKKNGKK